MHRRNSTYTSVSHEEIENTGSKPPSLNSRSDIFVQSNKTSKVCSGKFLVSLRSTLKSCGRGRNLRTSERPSRDELPNLLYTSRTQFDSCIQAISAMLRLVFKNVEALEWIPTQKLGLIYANLERLIVHIGDMKAQLGMNSPLLNRRVQGFQLEQAPLLVKTAIVALSKEISEFKICVESNINMTAILHLLDPQSLSECRHLAEDVKDTIKSAAVLLPCDALRTLSETRRAFGAFILRSMCLSGDAGATVSEAAVTGRLRALFATLDTDADGAVSRAELAAALAQGGAVVSDADLARLFTAADVDGDGAISLEELRRLVIDLLREHKVRVIPTALRSEEEGSAAVTDSEAKGSEMGVDSARALRPTCSQHQPFRRTSSPAGRQGSCCLPQPAGPFLGRVGRAGRGSSPDRWPRRLSPVRGSVATNAEQGPPSPLSAAATAIAGPRGASPVRVRAHHRSPTRRLATAAAPQPPRDSDVSPPRSPLRGLPRAAPRGASPDRAVAVAAAAEGLSSPLRALGGGSGGGGGGGYSHLQRGARALLPRRYATDETDPPPRSPLRSLAAAARRRVSPRRSSPSGSPLRALARATSRSPSRSRSPVRAGYSHLQPGARAMRRLSTTDFWAARSSAAAPPSPIADDAPPSPPAALPRFGRQLPAPPAQPCGKGAQGLSRSLEGSRLHSPQDWADSGRPAAADSDAAAEIRAALRAHGAPPVQRRWSSETVRIM